MLDATADRYDAEDLRRYSAALLAATGLPADKARLVAEVLIEADLLGQTTHGLALLHRYLKDIADGGMAIGVEPSVLSDRGACVTWDGRRLPGMYLAAAAADLAAERAATYGTVTIAVGNSHHIGCLGAYLGRVTGRGYMIVISASLPTHASVAPYGGRKPLLTPNPIGVGIPTGGDPILIDVSASITTNNLAARLRAENRRYPHPWLLDAEGEPTDDPAALANGGSILPAGGLDHGQKGYGMALMVEALTQGLSGFGRSASPKGWLTSFTIQVIDPQAFAGLEAFTRETGWIAEACSSNPPRTGIDKVRVPGERGLAHKRAAIRDGLVPHGGVMRALDEWAAKLAVTAPRPMVAGVAQSRADA